MAFVALLRCFRGASDVRDFDVNSQRYAHAEFESTEMRGLGNVCPSQHLHEMGGREGYKKGTEGPREKATNNLFTTPLLSFSNQVPAAQHADFTRCPAPHRSLSVQLRRRSRGQSQAIPFHNVEGTNLLSTI